MNTDDVAERIEAREAIRRMSESPADALIRIGILTVTEDGRLVPTGDASAVARRGATPRPVQDALTRKPARTGVPRERVVRSPSSRQTCGDRGTPYRQAHPMMAHPVRLEPVPAKRRRIAPDLLVIAVILAVVLAASLVRVSL